MASKKLNLRPLSDRLVVEPLEKEEKTASGIIDPAKVTRSAVENAASIAAMILTTDALITDVPEENQGPAMPPGGGEF